MSIYCFNPNCQKPENPDRETFCRNCGSTLTLRGSMHPEGNRYRAVKVLGQGGFSRTFLAIDSQFSMESSEQDERHIERYVVVKQLWQQNLNPENPESIKVRFQQESDSLRDAYCRIKQLGEHPQIPTLLDSFEMEGYLYLVHEYIEGKNLAIALSEIENSEFGNSEPSTFSNLQVWSILEAILPVLQFVHAHQIIHCDLKPSNIICRSATSLGDRTTWKDFALVDFGTAQFVSEFKLAQQGKAIGSPEYAAPEQVRGEAVFASDLYSLGVTCIHLLTGMRPFSLFDFVDNCWNWRPYWHSQAESLPLRQQALLEQFLGQILDRMIQPDLSKRFSTAAAILKLMNRSGIKSGVKQIFSPIPMDRPAKKLSEWRCDRTLIGHEGLFASVNAVVILTPDTIASASDDKTIRLWDWRSQQQIACLTGHTNFVKALSYASIYSPTEYSPTEQIPQTGEQENLHKAKNPRFLASGSADKTIKLWDLEAQQEILTITEHSHAVNAVAFAYPTKAEMNFDRLWLASGSADKTIKLWSLEFEQGLTAPTAKLIATLTGHHLAVNAIAFSPTAPILASASTDRTVKLWDLERFQLIQTLQGHTWAVNAIAFSPDGELLATGGDDNTIQLWNVANGTILRTLSGHPWAVSAIAFSPDGKTLISGSWDKTLKLWQVSTGKELDMLSGHTDSVSCLAVGNGDLLVSGSKDKTLKIWCREDKSP
ncbi:serine/threonine-protein kinase [Tumidithrix elongata RA019]|uniref:Serine/threonine-protein kinase n=1 Tax=Tumidithrix elongata BACA0141 TaxID=2716417 RepID=A0AAW9Q6R2_9CYAN|nr:serine/threonine-protein kinase [Tumidithrix elongata RA019]